MFSNIPAGAIPVSNFQKDKYLGTWYEIARMDFMFEKNLDNTTATYSLNSDGSIKVDNRGYDYKNHQHKQAIGKAKFIGKDNIAMLKVSFFGPFYAPYNVIEIDGEYKFALVVGKNLKYMWILSREKNIPEEVKEKYINTAKNLGFQTDKLIWVKHN